MVRLALFFALPFFCLPRLSAQTVDLVPYEFFDSSGVRLNFHEVVDRMASVDVVLFGEQHDHALVHWLQYRAALALSGRGELVLGGEFFETDDQVLVDEWLAGYMDRKRFEAEAKTWVNFDTDYAPLLELARDSSLKFVATNVPRRYASFVAKFGLDTLAGLPEASRAFLPDLPVPYTLDTPGYRAMLDMMSGGHAGGGAAENFVKAQALKDYTMASGILDHLPDDGVFYHVNGDYHSAEYGGIYHYIRRAGPGIRLLTVKVVDSLRPGFDPSWQGKGDVILRVPSDFTKTH